MATGDTASDPSPRPWPNEGEEGSLTLQRGRQDPGPRGHSKAATSPKSTAEEPARMLRKSGRQQRPSSTLNNLIDLDALGPPTRPDQPALQGMFAVAGNTPTATAQERRNLVVHSLIRMALDWGYLDARARLIPLASS